MDQQLALPGTSSAPRAPSPTLTFVLAFLAGCPVLMNLIGTYIADGNSFVSTVAITCLALACAGGAALRIGTPLGDFQRWTGPCLAFACVAALFWSYWSLINLISPSPQQQMEHQLIQSALWLSLPIAIFLLWRRWIATERLVPMMVVLAFVFVSGLMLRWVLGLGFYHSGRWQAGDSLDAIRAARYAGIALWIFAIACFCPPRIVGLRLKALALCGFPLALFMAMVSNSRGPALALAVTLLCTAVPLARLLARHINRDARLLLVLIVAAAMTTAFVASQIDAVESDFGRLFTLTQDGGSAQERVTLWQDHLQLANDTPLALISGFGYSHGNYYPHNVLLEALIDGGVVLFVLLLCMPVIGLRAWLSPRLADDVPGLLFAGLFILNLIGSQVSNGIGTDMSWYGGLLLVLRHDELGRQAARA
jgi:hypothetical protein